MRNTIPTEDLDAPLSLFSTDPVSTLSEIMQSSLYRASHTFSHVFDGSIGTKNTFIPLLDTINVSPSTETFISELSALVEFLDSDDLSWDRFGAFRIRGLRTIADAYGRESVQYTTAAAALSAALRNALRKPHLNLVIFTYPLIQVGVAKRQDQSPFHHTYRCHLSARTRCASRRRKFAPIQRARVLDMGHVCRRLKRDGLVSPVHAKPRRIRKVGLSIGRAVSANERT
ncbi:hypothetical protein B0F90DRAFT_1054019 [Multifurca ochricompacta]|uniref:Uncharacterized protein n=1 Tax=Multifurca ochricompacta TaxID=376703 RepID=A0AAD4M998_9AGAM|nr:hypothetical protein B0F90DRAFT_1054019 [Multifurca ochricompacta]